MTGVKVSFNTVTVFGFILWLVLLCIEVETMAFSWFIFLAFNDVSGHFFQYWKLKFPFLIQSKCPLCLALIMCLVKGNKHDAPLAWFPVPEK